jgi:hypothetical protein
MTRLEVSFTDAGALLAFVDQRLSRGMVFLPDAGGVEPLSPCSLVVSMGARTVTLRAEIVYVRDDGPGKGVGLQLALPDVGTIASLHALAEPSRDGAIPDLLMPELPMPDLPMADLARRACRTLRRTRPRRR